MATNGADSSAGPGDEGTYVKGRFLEAFTSEGRPRPDGSGRYPDRFKVALLTGRRTVEVEYRDSVAARSALVAAGAMADLDDQYPAPMTTLVLPVGVRSAQGFTFFFGRGGRE